MRILLITKSFPPSRSAQSLQSFAVARALAKVGVQVDVVAGGESPDNAACSVPGLAVSWVPESSQSLLRRIPKAPKLLREIREINRLDAWVRHAIATSMEFIASNKPSVVVSQSTPFTSHLVGMAVAQHFELPWVASFSDPYPIHIAPSPYSMTNRVPGLNALQRQVARKALRSASVVHLTSPYARQTISTGLGVDFNKRRSVVIPHVAADVDFPTSPGDGTLAHVGHITRERTHRAVFEALADLRANPCPGFRGLRCIGQVCPEFHSLVREYGMESMIDIEPPIEQDRALAEMRRASALLVAEARMDVSPFLPSKVADYAGVGRPIVAITPPVSYIRDLLSIHGGGIATVHDSRGVSAAVRAVIGGDVKAGQEAGLAAAMAADTVAKQYRAALDLAIGTYRVGVDQRA